MTGSPFSNVLPHNPGEDNEWYEQGLSGQVGDTTTETDTRPPDTDTESSIGVERDGAGDTHESGQDETQGQTDESGTNVTGT